MNAILARNELHKFSDAERAKILQRFFKTGPGEYGEGDIFLGIKVPQVRQVAKMFWQMPLNEVLKLLKSKFHEERLLSLFILKEKFIKGDDKTKTKIHKSYLKHTRYINNWDFVDLSAEYIVGNYILDKDKSILFKLAKSKNFWERRIAIISTFHMIKQRQFKETLQIAEILLQDEEDLIHKAVGWMLREIGKRDLKVEEGFLKNRYKNMPRTMLRYAIEKFPETKRQAYLKK